MIKDDATILDCTCGNRSIYVLKESLNIIYIDIENDLTIKPDIIMDIRNTNFIDNRFRVVIFDPPNEWNRVKNKTMFTTPNLEMHNKLWEKWKRNTPPRYYGGDKYKSKLDLMDFIIDAEIEIYRILNDRGLLIMKWSEYKINKREILNIFNRWNRLIDIPIKHNAENAKGSYWFIMQKKEIE